MPALPNPFRDRKKSSSHKLRWLAVIGAAVLAIAWRTQTAISGVPKRLKAAIGGSQADADGQGGTATLERPETEAGQEASSDTATQTPSSSSPETNVPATNVPLTNPAQGSAAAMEDVAADEMPSAPEASSADATSEQQASSANGAEASGGVRRQPTNVPPSNVVTTDVPTRPGEPETVGAGEDDTGTFRPTKAEPDEFGVVVTDTEPAGLAGEANWVEPNADGECPEDHPIKGNATSRIFHMPGQSSYAQTRPEYCFASEEDAVAAGFRPRAR